MPTPTVEVLTTRTDLPSKKSSKIQTLAAAIVIFGNPEVYYCVLWESGRNSTRQ